MNMPTPQLLLECFDDRVSSYGFDAIFHELHAGIVLFPRFCIDFVLLDACIVISGSILYGYWLFIVLRHLVKEGGTDISCQPSNSGHGTC
jgi:hypothetical protein